jgi:hypothetical protein
MVPRESHGCPFLFGVGTYSPEFVYPLQTAGSSLTCGVCYWVFEWQTVRGRLRAAAKVLPFPTQ